MSGGEILLRSMIGLVIIASGVLVAILIDTTVRAVDRGDLLGLAVLAACAWYCGFVMLP